MDPFFKDGITLAIASLAFILSLVNTCYNLFRDRIRVRVRTSTGIFADGTTRICFVVQNLSYIPITISRAKIATREKMHIPIVSTENPFPIRMEPRTSEIIRSFSRGEKIFLLNEEGKSAEIQTLPCLNVFVETACGRKFWGKKSQFRGNFEMLSV